MCEFVCVSVCVVLCCVLCCGVMWCFVAMRCVVCVCAYACVCVCVCRCFCVLGYLLGGSHLCVLLFLSISHLPLSRSLSVHRRCLALSTSWLYVSRARELVRQRLQVLERAPPSLQHDPFEGSRHENLKRHPYYLNPPHLCTHTHTRHTTHKQTHTHTQNTHTYTHTPIRCSRSCSCVGVCNANK